MTDLFSKAQAAVGAIRERAEIVPRVGIILGSGLGGFAAQVEGAVAIAYAEIPHFPQSTVVGHRQAGDGDDRRRSRGRTAGAGPCVRGLRDGAGDFPTRVLGLLGVRTLIVTNAAGGIRADIAQGSLVAISDHINLTGMNAALGPNEPRFACVPGAGQRFFDMTAAYSPRLRKLARDEAARQGIALSEGVYIAVLGPSYETPAEIRAFRTLGADLVGMSTVHEVIVARHMGMEVLGISLVTNAAAGVLDEPIHHEEVMEMGRRVERQFTGLLTALVPQIAGRAQNIR